MPRKAIFPHLFFIYSWKIIFLSATLLAFENPWGLVFNFLLGFGEFSSCPSIVPWWIFYYFFYWTTEFLVFLSRKREKKERIGRVLLTKRISVSWLIFSFIFTFICCFRVWILGTWSCRKSPVCITRWQDLCLRARCIKAEIRRNRAQSPNAGCETWLWHERVRSALVKIRCKKVSLFSESCISCFYRPRKRTMRIVTSWRPS